MQKPPLDPDVADTAPSDSVLTTYDEEYVITYLRLLDADAQGADWREVARVVLQLPPSPMLVFARRIEHALDVPVQCFMIPMRANIGGPSCSATSNSASIAACHSSASCSALARQYDRIEKLLIP